MNKTILMLLVIALLSISMVSAVKPVEINCYDLGYDWQKDGGVGSIDNECQNAGFDFGIAKWERGEGFSKESEAEDYTTFVEGGEYTANWTSNPAADGILSKEGNCYQILPGGESGSIDNLVFGISHVTMCGNDGDDNGHEVPEFGVFGFIAVALAGAGILIFKRK